MRGALQIAWAPPLQRLHCGAAGALTHAPARVQIAAVIVGGGSSALATTLFTLAFTFGDPITPQILQKLQPLIAIALAAAVLGERLRARFALFVVPALVGAWLLSFADPLDVTIGDAQAAALALGAAAFWAGGTVLGRLVDGHLGPRHTLVLRFGFGLPAAAIIVALTGAGWTMPTGQLPNLLLLVLIPGLLALSLYYVGLRRTAATRATLAELMFPVTAAVVGVTVLEATMTPTRWLGMVVVVASVTALAWHERSARTPAVRAHDIPERQPTAQS